MISPGIVIPYSFTYQPLGKSSRIHIPVENSFHIERDVMNCYLSEVPNCLQNFI